VSAPDTAARGLSARLAATPAYSYRVDPAVPAFPDDKALVVFDGVCVLCAGLARFLIKRDPGFTFRFATAQSPLGQALYRHYGLDQRHFATNLVLFKGRVYGKLDTLAVSGALLGGPWRLLQVLRILPHALADRAYDAVARNRFRLFGRSARCMIPPGAWRARFLG
jgi:predicted DCC family thiol-disulfide oxidoreductase YuxK